MNWKEALNCYGEEITCQVSEEKIQELRHRGIQIVTEIQQKSRLSYWEFLYMQLGMIRKKWWAFQVLLLLMMLFLLPNMRTETYVSSGVVTVEDSKGAEESTLMEEPFIERTLGIVGALFIVLIIPELWRNRSNDSMQIEAACRYSLRQVYAARITWFGMVDTLMMTLFCIFLGGRSTLRASDIMVDLLLPMVVAAAICFFSLCNQRTVGETSSVLGCLLWCAIWLCIVRNDVLYSRISIEIWSIVFASAICLLICAVIRAIRVSDRYWEVNEYGTAAD